MTTYLLTIGIIFLLLAGLTLVQRFYRHFAGRHPELGPYRDESAGCGSCGGCAGTSCKTPSRPAGLP